MSHPGRSEVWLSENAFISMVAAAVEAFPDETLGVLIGFRDLGWRKFLTQYAIVYQTAERARDQVSADPNRMRRMDKFIERVTTLEVIGDFHSHPKVPVRRKSSCWLSEDDKKSMSPGDLGFVIAINRDHKERDWKHLKMGSLLGCVFPYSLKITGWHMREKSKPRIAKIHCPFALGLGR